MNEYLFVIIIVTNLKCQIAQQFRIGNTSKTQTSKTETSKRQSSELQTSKTQTDLKTLEPLKNDLNCKRS